MNNKEKGPLGQAPRFPEMEENQSELGDQTPGNIVALMATILEEVKEEIMAASLRYNENLKKIPAGVYVMGIFEREKREIIEKAIQKLTKLL